jgi:hypothetical protein
MAQDESPAALTDADIAEGLRLDAAATPGEWTLKVRTPHSPPYVTWERTEPPNRLISIVAACETADCNTDEDAALIVHARNHYAAALRDLARTRLALRELRDAVEVGVPQRDWHKGSIDMALIEADSILAAVKSPTEARNGH